MQIALCCPVHDKDGRYISVLQKWGSTLSELYGAIFISVTPSTSPLTRTLLQDLGYVVTVEGSQYGDGRRLALVDAAREGFEQFHVSDFDRMLHWVGFYPQELREALSQERRGLTVAGRTERAFSTHPRSWTITESISNNLFSEVFGGTFDLCAGSFFLDRPTARVVEAESVEKGVGILQELPFLAHAHNLPVSYEAFEGYEWEDPDRFEYEIKRAGYDGWMRRYDEYEEWKKRFAMLDEMVRVTFRYRTMFDNGKLGRYDKPKGDRHVLYKMRHKK